MRQNHFYYHCQYCKKERFRAEKVNNTLFDGLEGLKFNQDAEVLYEQIVKELFDDSTESNEDLIKKLSKKLTTISDKIQKIQELILDDKISAEDYGEMSENLKKERLKYQDELRELKAQNTDYHTWTELTLSETSLKGLLIAALKRNKKLLVRYFLKNYNLTEKKFEPLFSMKHYSIFSVLTRVVAS